MIFADDDNVSRFTSDDAFRLKAIFLIHFICTTWALQGYWYPSAYLFYNAFFMGAVLWTLHQNNTGLAMKVATTINQLAILFDIIILSVYFPSGNRGGTELFSATMAILNLLLRPISLGWLISKQDSCEVKEPLIGRAESGYQDIEAQRPNAS